MPTLKELGLRGVIDVHTHTGADTYNLTLGRYPNHQTTEELLGKTQEAGIDSVITFPFPSTEYWDTQILVRSGQLVASGEQRFPYQRENEILVSDAKGHPQIYPFACIHPIVEPEKQLLFLDSRLGRIKGLKMHPLACHTSVAGLIDNPITEYAARNNLPILFHSGLDNNSHPSSILELARHYKNQGLRVCIAHLACFDEEILKTAAKTDNVYVDTSPFVHLMEKYKRESKYLIRNDMVDPNNYVETFLRFYSILKDKLMWGSDEPYTSVVKPDKGTTVEGSYAMEVELLVGLAKKNIVAFENITNRNTFRFLLG